MSGKDLDKGSRTGEGDAVAPTTSSRSEIDSFLSAARTVKPSEPGEGRLVFALDATMSRQPTWDAACRLQGEMFGAVKQAGKLDVQLVYFRGFGECRASRWVGDALALRDLMVKIDCRGGHTQIAKVLKHAREETTKRKVSALIYIGDAMEENIDRLCDLAGELGMRGVPCFMFHEGRDATAEKAFREIARLSSGAYFRFDENAANALSQLLQAVAIYATGGRKALAASRSSGARLLLEQLGSSKGGR